ncbi:ribonuclease H-like domain-containing protein [Chlamydoabsidia padenii]|nr:ribonuclease H-like domain-containing protein [Chlamydoabsidia padenii]
MVDGFRGAKYRKFETLEEAEAFAKGSAAALPPVSKRKRDDDDEDDDNNDTPLTTRQRLDLPIPKGTRVVYTDGASRANGRKNAKAGYGVFWGDNDPRNLSAPLEGERQTNQRAEAMAILRALEQSQDMADRLEIRTDSQYCIKAMTEWHTNWVKKKWISSTGQAVQNRDLFEPMLQLVKNRKGPTEFIYVPGHRGVYDDHYAQGDYTEEVVNINFTNNEDYDVWFTTVASKRAAFLYKDSYEPKTMKPGRPAKTIYYRCDHAGVPEKKKCTTSENKRRKTVRSPIKVGCTAKIAKHTYVNGEIKVVYNWIHKNHDPGGVEDITSSRLPLEVRQWIVECVNRHMNLKSIKSLLRMNIEQLDEQHCEWSPPSCPYYQEARCGENYQLEAEQPLKKTLYKFGWKALPRRIITPSFFNKKMGHLLLLGTLDGEKIKELEAKSYRQENI